MTERKGYKVVPVQDAQGNTFEAYELRRVNNHMSLFVDIRMAESVGGIEIFRNGLAPAHLIVTEVLI